MAFEFYGRNDMKKELSIETNVLSYLHSKYSFARDKDIFLFGKDIES